MSHRNPMCFAVLSGAIALLIGTVGYSADSGPHWGYEGETGPEHWAKLSPDFAACSAGVNQSPVDIVDALDADLAPLEFDYRSGSTEVVNNGHTLQVNVKPGNWLMTGDEKFELLQFHFHSPSEHHVEGQSFPLEAHFVHQGEKGNLVVVGIMFHAGEHNDDLEAIGNAGPKQAGRTNPFDIDFSVLDFYHDHEFYYRYNGSLTTPPCSEGVRWYVLKETQPVSLEQAAAFVDMIGEDARGPQPLNARLVLEH